MNIKHLSIMLALFMLVLCIGSVSAAQDANDTVSIEENSVDDAVSVNQDDISEMKNVEKEEKNVIKADEISSDQAAQTTTKTTAKTVKKTTVIAPDTNFIFKRNSVFKIKIKDKETNKTIKNLKLTFKIKDGKKIKTYTIKTNNKGIATFKTKKLSLGYHKYKITSQDSRYKVSKKDRIFIGNLYIDTVNMGSYKKLRNRDYLQTFVQKKDKQFKKGVYALTNIDAKYTQIVKAKFYFKNKKTGEIITVKSRGKLIDIDGEIYRDIPKVDLMKGYTPIKTKIYYLMSKLDV